MGGYAASAYASVLDADLAILLNPISSLRADATAFETRFKNPKLADWQGRYNDGVEGVKAIKSYIVYDSLFELDAIHAKRYLSASNT
ncbi:hypothetical protein, partial [Psychrobacter sp.]|uniref:hypothetical protein n=1 Tax=Psychrobacter sp. TaxID=56811 RepID=UPI002647E07E